jgi:SAM-dependent methyltransferase
MLFAACQEPRLFKRHSPQGAAGALSGRDRYEIEGAQVERYASTSFWDARYHNERLRRVSEVLSRELRTGDSFLDVGCGTGDYLREAIDLGACSVIGTDVSSSYCRRARGLPACIVQADAGSLPFRTGALDVVLCSEVIEHLEPAICDLAVRELLRASQRAVVLTTPNRRALIRRLAVQVVPRRMAELDESVGHINLLDLGQLVEYATKRGWTITSVRTTHVCPPVVGESARLPPSLGRLVGLLEGLGDRLAPRSGNISILVARRAVAP